MAPAEQSLPAPWFAFIAHLRSRRDLDKWNVTAAMRSSGAVAEHWQDQVLRAPPVVLSTISFRSTPVTGDLIMIPRLPEDVIYGDGPELVARAVEIAAERGAPVVGLAGLTAPATRGGQSLLASLPPGVTLTNGNAFTALVARQNVREACEYLERSHPVVAILGSTGSVGAAASSLLMDDDLELWLIGRSTQRARDAAPRHARGVRFSSDLSDVRRADVVLVLTSDSSARLSPDHFDNARERVVVDVAQPSNIPTSSRGSFLQSRVHVVRGGWVRLPGATSSHHHRDLMTEDDPDAPPGTAPACLAETCLFAVAGIREHAVGPASADLARRLEPIAARRGVLMRNLAFTSDTPEGGHLEAYPMPRAAADG
jgi:fatty aldehyde-generating acyl-ACP reductase